MKSKKAAFYVLGCKVNQYEAEALKSLFRQAGYSIVSFEEDADIYVIHTCTVTHLADRKSRQAVRKIARQHPEAVVAVTGCYSQVAASEVKDIPGVDAVVGTKDLHRLVEIVEKAQQKGEQQVAVSRYSCKKENFTELPVEKEKRARAFVKIQEGCDGRCSYCIVPLARGPARSRRPEKVLAEIEKLRDTGYKEIVLTGVHIGAYGLDFPSGMDLSGLLKRVLKLPGLPRLRLSSLEPHEFTRDLKEVIASEGIICPHLHIPLQSGDDTILKRMNRRYSAGEYIRLIEEIKLMRPEILFTTDVIVGFPGETQEQFEKTCQVVSEVAFLKLHVFRYSPREGTLAASFGDQVDEKIKRERSAALIALGERLWRRHVDLFIGKRLMVLAERKTGGNSWEGRAENYLKIRFPGPRNLRGKIVPVRLKEAGTGFVWGIPD